MCVLGVKGSEKKILEQPLGAALLKYRYFLLISLLSIIPVLLSVSSIVAIVIVRYHTMKVPVVR